MGMAGVAEVAEIARAGRAAWPGVELADAELAAYLADKGELGRAADLYLAAACLARVPAALAAFDAILEAELRAGLARIDVPGAEPKDIGQKLRIRLLLGEGDAPARIGEYRGQGDLRGWIRVIVVREALMAKRRLGRETELAADDVLADRVEDDELKRIGALYGPEVKRAILDAVRALDSQERTVLRMHLVERLTTPQIGAALGVHHATAARWILKAKQEMVETSRELLRERLNVSETELLSLLRVVESQVDLTLGTALREG